MPAARAVPDAVSFLGTIRAGEKRGVWRMTALGLLKAMDTAEVSPDARTFNAAIACCEPRGHWQLASHLLEAMTESQLQPNATTRTSMMIACCKAHWPLALHFLNMAEGAAEDEVRSWNAALGACARARQWQMAFHLFNVSASDVETLLPSLPQNLGLAALESAVREGRLTLECTPRALELRGVWAAPQLSGLATRWWLKAHVAPELAQRRKQYRPLLEPELTGK
ncbi:unnamed protein product [Effrenium voratum]|nr:unnamed protein product [Effrenium voratum]